MSLLHNSRWLIWKQRLKSFVFSWSAGCVFSTPINCNRELRGWELSGCLSFPCQPAPCFPGRGFKYVFIFIPTLWNDPIWQKACFSTWVEKPPTSFSIFFLWHFGFSFTKPNRCFNQVMSPWYECYWQRKPIPKPEIITVTCGPGDATPLDGPKNDGNWEMVDSFRKMLNGHFGVFMWNFWGVTNLHIIPWRFGFWSCCFFLFMGSFGRFQEPSSSMVYLEPWRIILSKWLNSPWWSVIGSPLSRVVGTPSKWRYYWIAYKWGVS